MDDSHNTNPQTSDSFARSSMEMPATKHCTNMHLELLLSLDPTGDSLQILAKLNSPKWQVSQTVVADMLYDQVEVLLTNLLRKATNELVQAQRELRAKKGGGR